MIVVPNATALAILTDQVTALSILDGAIVMLYQNSVVVSRTTLLADLDECDFHGYARSAAIVWGVPFIGPDGIPTVVGDLKTFVATSGGSLNPQLVYGYAVLAAAGTSVLWCENFVDENGAPDPVNIGAVGDQVLILPQLGGRSQAAAG